MAQISITEGAELLSRHHPVQTMPIEDRRRFAAEKWAMRDEGPPIDDARWRAVLWGTELEFWREGFGEFWGDSFDGEEVVDGADGGFGSGLYNAFGEFFADTGE